LEQLEIQLQILCASLPSRQVDVDEPARLPCAERSVSLLVGKAMRNSGCPKAGAAHPNTESHTSERVNPIMTLGTQLAHGTRSYSEQEGYEIAESA
jgi:hypothetical protein